MIRLIRYNLRNQLTRISTYLTPLIVFITIMLIKVVMNTDSGLMNTFNNIGSTFFFMSKSFFVELTIFIGSLAFVGITINNIYKNSIEDGSIMIIVSKPIKRKNMIFGNLFSLGISIFIFGLSIFTLYGFSTFLDSGSSLQKFLNSLSIFGGTIVIMFIFTSIILLLGSFMNSKSMIIFAIITSTFIPLISIVISLTAEPELSTAKNYKYVYSSDYISNKNLESIYVDMSQVEGETNQANELKSSKVDIYKSLAFIDPWYQLSGLFNMFNDKEHTHINWKKSTSMHEGQLILNEHKYSMVSEVTLNDDYLSYLHTIETNIKNIEYINILKNNSKIINEFTFEKQIMLMTNLFKRGTLSSAVINIPTDINEVKTASDDNAIRSFHDASPAELKFLDELVQNKVFNLSKSTNIKPGIFFTTNNWNSYLIENQQKINTFIEGDYINKTYLLIFWTIIVLIFFGLIILVEFKRDIISH